MTNSTLAVVFGLLGVLFIGLGVPLFRGSIGVNGLYGFRTPKTMSDETVWYEANKILGRDLIIAGTLELLGAVIIALSLKSADLFRFAMTNVVVLVLLVLVAVVHSSMRVARI